MNNYYEINKVKILLKNKIYKLINNFKNFKKYELNPLIILIKIKQKIIQIKILHFYKIPISLRINTKINN